MPAVNIQLAARKYDLPAECWQVFEQQPVKIRFFCPADAGERALASDTIHTSADRRGTDASTPSSPFPSPPSTKQQSPPETVHTGGPVFRF